MEHNVWKSVSLSCNIKEKQFNPKEPQVVAWREREREKESRVWSYGLYIFLWYASRIVSDHCTSFLFSCLLVSLCTKRSSDSRYNIGCNDKKRERNFLFSSDPREVTKIKNEEDDKLLPCPASYSLLVSSSFLSLFVSEIIFDMKVTWRLETFLRSQSRNSNKLLMVTIELLCFKSVSGERRRRPVVKIS